MSHNPNQTDPTTDPPINWADYNAPPGDDSAFLDTAHNVPSDSPKRYRGFWIFTMTVQIQGQPKVVWVGKGFDPDRSATRETYEKLKQAIDLMLGPP